MWVQTIVIFRPIPVNGSHVLTINKKDCYPFQWDQMLMVLWRRDFTVPDSGIDIRYCFCWIGDRSVESMMTTKISDGTHNHASVSSYSDEPLSSSIRRDQTRTSWTCHPTAPIHTPESKHILLNQSRPQTATLDIPVIPSIAECFWLSYIPKRTNPC